MSENESVSELFVKEIVNNLKNHHAAVLVGAGFSRNAIRLDGSEKLMPDWNELAKIFCEKLGLKYTNNQYIDPLSLAQQVEVLYGKPYLNNLLKTVMEDEAYQPGKVHDLLMSLPWTDVFTTNYDTLLERAFKNGTGKISYKISDIAKLFGEYKKLLVGIGNNKLRETVYQEAAEIGYTFPNIIVDSAYVSPYATIGTGCIILNHAVVQNNAKVGNGVILNTGVEIHNDSVVEDYVLIYTNSVVRTYAHVGKRAHLGSTLTIGNNVNVPDDSVVENGRSIN